MRIRAEQQGAVLVLTMDNPARRNALSLPLRVELAGLLDAAEADASVRALVLTGADGFFSAGGDLQEMEVANALQGRERLRIAHKIIRLLAGGSKPVVAAVEGWAAGAGLSLACACDTIVAARDARFVASFGKVGLMADLGLAHTLPARIGMGRARQLLLFAEPMDATTAEAIGLVDEIAEPGQALPRALEKAQQLAAMAPLAIALTKQILVTGLDAALEAERHYQSLLFASADHAEGKAAFFQKRSPHFTGG